ncbi:MAG: phosphopyruvate hydratase [Proteobacteria bacterium]|nr:phosphopyruvate hydratase [Burkholderiales bacterium]
MQSTIVAVAGHRIWDSRGRPTVEVEVTLADGTRGRGMAPAGASRGAHEAVDLRDGGMRHGGFDVMHAVRNVNDIVAPHLLGLDALDQHGVDQVLVAVDGTPNKSRLGGNATIATSMAVMHAAAAASGLPLWKYLAEDTQCSLPMPEVQIFGGGAHAGQRVDIQDFLVMPAGSGSFDEALAICAEIYRAAGELMAQRKSRCGVADEGGWWPDFASNEEALSVLTDAIERAGCGGGKALISLDIAASEFYRDGLYRLGLEGKTFETGAWLAELYRWIERYPIISVEDPVAEDDVAGMRAFTAAVGSRVQVVGDDFLVTDAARVAHAAAAGCCNAVLIKPNQAGTVSETRAALLAGHKAAWGTIVSARSGETEDVCITHMAVGWNAGQLKVGSFARSERMAKWNEGLRIERSGAALSGFAGMTGVPVSARGNGDTEASAGR